MKKDKAFSGLEAAIVLIAFVVVAAVFSYVMLGAGFFATQKSQEVTYSGVKQTTSNLILDGSLYGTQITGHSYLSTVVFYLSIPEGGQPQKLTDVDYGVTVNGNKYQYATSLAASKFTIGYSTTEGDVDSNGILPTGGKAKMTLNFYGTAAATGCGPAPGGKFTLEIRPSVGASTLIEKSLITGYTGGVIL